MAVPTTQIEARYTGTGTGPYVIPFAFLANSHVHAAVSADGVEDPVPLSPSEFTVTRLSTGLGGSLVTQNAVTNPEVLVISRNVPLTQPTRLPLAGPLRAPELETALDRLAMQVQQVDRRVTLELLPGGTSDDSATAFTRWNASISYAVGDVVIYDDGNLYRAAAPHSGEMPNGDDGANWRLWRVNVNTTLSVPARFATLAAAWDFAAGGFIAADATLTIQLADGTHTIGRKVFNHPCGGRIRILGNVATPTSCILNAAGVTYTSGQWAAKEDGLIAVSDGHTLGFLDGFRIVGPGNGQTGLGGLFAINQASITCGTHMVIEDCYFCVATFNGSAVDCPEITVSGGGDGNLFAYNGSVISARDCNSSGANTYFAKSGALAEHASCIWAPGGYFHDNDGHQVGAHFGSSLMLNGATLEVTGGLVGFAGGVRLINSDNLDLDGVTFTGCDVPLARTYNASYGAVKFVVIGMHKQLFTPAGRLNVLCEGNTISTLAVIQDGVQFVALGFAANSTTAEIVNGGAQINLRVNGTNAGAGGTVGLIVTAGKTTVPRLNLSNAPTSASGLVAGDVWSDGGTLKLV